MRSALSIAAALALVVPSAGAAPAKVCAACVQANMERLASPAMHGRACGTADENGAAAFVAERLKAYGIKGAADGGGYLQHVEFRSPTFAAPPALEVGETRFVHGDGIIAMDAPEALTGPLALIAKGDPPEAASGKVALLDGDYDPVATRRYLQAGALAAVAPIPDAYLDRWAQLAERPPRGTQLVGVDPELPPAPDKGMIFAKREAFLALKDLVGREARFAAPRGAPVARTTYNVLGVIHGREAGADQRAILLSAHYDHLGVRAGQLYPGANDDASGTAAVLEFARQLGAKKKAPQRTVQFALFGCEEEGGHGARYFLAHPPTPLTNLAANLEFEMIGVPDPKDRKALMLTGWERSNLGPTLRGHGASVGPDHYPEQNFFQRSDNYQLAKKGVVAQTISAWPIPPTYHQPSDDLAHLDLPFMIEVIQSLAEPIDWLANNDFQPQWVPGMQP